MLVTSAPPLVSIIVSMRNSAPTVGAAVRSVLMQTLRDWELIVIDDGSTDRSGAIVEGFHDERIRLIHEILLRWTLAARLATQAVALAKGEFIARMDADDICFPERLARQVACLREEPRLDLIGCGAVVFTSEGKLLDLGRCRSASAIRTSSRDPLSAFRFLRIQPGADGPSWFRKNSLQFRRTQICRRSGPASCCEAFATADWAGLDKVLLRLSPGSIGSEEAHSLGRV